MKSPHIPIAQPTLRTLGLVAILLAAAMLAQLSEASPQVEPYATLRRCHRHAHHRSLRKPPAFPRPGPPPSWCIHISRSHHHRPPPAPQASGEIDLGYGAEKRLVPTGPNPLHN